MPTTTQPGSGDSRTGAAPAGATDQSSDARTSAHPSTDRTGGSDEDDILRQIMRASIRAFVEEDGADPEATAAALSRMRLLRFDASALSEDVERANQGHTDPPTSSAPPQFFCFSTHTGRAAGSAASGGATEGGTTADKGEVQTQNAQGGKGGEGA